ncbi:MAG: methyltransferase [Pseudomonadota bacterium]
MSNPLSAGAVRTLAGLLADTAPFWQPPCFHDDPPWVVARPALAAALLAPDDDTLAMLENDPARLHGLLAATVPELAALQQTADACLHDAPLPVPPALPEVLGRDVPGRKWQQTLAFAAAAGAPQGAVVDWCCGKAHLGRLLARLHGVRVTGIERNAALCESGRLLATRDRLDVTLLPADALQIRAADAQLDARAHAVALHACGDLHLALLRTAAGAQVAALDVAPCCYHLTRDVRWQPLSAALRDSPLTALAPARDDLRLAVQETVTASRRVIRQTRELAGWRLGFDRLQRSVRGIDRALPTPSRPARVLADGFAAFCRDMAAHHGLQLPPDTDFPHWETLGHERLQRSRRLQLLRHAFRRPLEILLVADRALWLGEQGYEVRLRTFCPRALTPRNLLIQARRTVTAA